MRYLVRFELDKSAVVEEAMRMLGVMPVAKVLDYIVIDVPPELKPKIQEIPGVIEIVEEKLYRISIPIEAKLSKFMELGGPLSIQALLWSLSVKERERWTTFEARRMVGADIAEAEGITGRGVKVAVVDTGIDAYANPQLPSLLPLIGSSSVDGQPWWQDENGHGTHVATTIGGRSFPTPWGMVKGVAPDVTLGFFKCLGYGIGSGTNTSVLRSMMDAFEWGADLVNMSLGGDVKPDERHEIDKCPICRAVRMLSESGMIFAIAAGNSGVGYASCPGIAPEAVTIAAVDSSGMIADFTSRRHTQYLDLNKPNVSAPGVNLLSSTVGLIDLMEWMDGPKLAAISGTSMATPMACGVIALWLQYARDRGFKLSYRDIHECIRMGRGWDPDYGYGIIRYEWIKDYLRR